MLIKSFVKDMPKTWGNIVDNPQDYAMVVTNEELQNIDENSDLAKTINLCGGLMNFIVNEIAPDTFCIKYNIGLVN